MGVYIFACDKSRFLMRYDKNIGLMIVLAHLKICWRSFEVKVAPANNLCQQNFAGATPENTDTATNNMLEWVHTTT